MSQISSIDAPLTDIERRFIAHLGQPRNLFHLSHELRTDEHTTVQVPQEDGTFVAQNFMAHPDDIQALLDNAVKKGWVTEIDTQSQNPGKIAHAAQQRKDSFDWHDDSAKLFEKRLLVPSRQWRLAGPHYIITKDGVQKLHEPVGAVGIATFEDVQRAVDEMWKRTIKDVTVERAQSNEDWDQPLAQKLLQDEFLDWYGMVADECEARTGRRPRAPMAGGAGWFDGYESNIIDNENQKTAFPALVAPWFMHLTILAYTDTETTTTLVDGSHKPSYTGYAAKSVAAADMGAASAGSATNANAIQFAACTAGTSNIVGFANADAAAATIIRKYGTCTSTTVSTTQTPAQFAASAYTTTAD